MFLTTPTNQPKQITKGGEEGKEAEDEKELKIDIPNCHPLWSCKCLAPCRLHLLACFLRFPIEEKGRAAAPSHSVVSQQILAVILAHLALILCRLRFQMDWSSLQYFRFAAICGQLPVVVLVPSFSSAVAVCGANLRLRLCQDLRCSLSSLSRRGNPLVAARRKLYKTYNKTELSQHVSLPTPPFIFMWLGHPPTPVLLSLPPAPPPIRPYSKNTLLHLLLLRFLWLKNIGLCCKVYSIFNEWFDLIYLHALLWSSVCLSDLNTHSKFQLICSCSFNNILCHHVIHTSHFASLK